MKNKYITLSQRIIVSSLALMTILQLPAQVLNFRQTVADKFGPITHTAISPDGKHAYVTAYEDNGITVYDRDTSTGRLFFSEALFDNGLDANDNALTGLNQPRMTAISPDGQFVYVACEGDDNAINVFHRDPATGSLTIVEVIRDGGTDQQNNRVDGLDGVRAVIVSPKGEQVYAAGTYEQAIAVFTRDTTTGRLTFVEALKDGATDSQGQTVDGLRNAIDLVMSPDSKFLYVTSPGDNNFFSKQDNAVAVFKRKQTTHRLAFVQVLKDGGTDPAGQTVDGLNYSPDIAVSPDGQHLYIASKLDDAVAVFQRNQQTGVLNFVQIVKNNKADAAGETVTGLNAASGVAVSADGNYVFVVSDVEDDLVVFSRNSATGQLTLAAQFQEGGTDKAGNTVAGITGATDLALSPDGQYIYLTGSSAVAAFYKLPHAGIATRVAPIFRMVLGAEMNSQFAAIQSPLYGYMNGNKLSEEEGMRLMARWEAAKASMEQNQAVISINLLHAMNGQVTAFKRAGTLAANLANDLQDQVDELISLIEASF